MVEFFEPEDEYKVEKGYRRNIKTKITFLTALIVFGLLLISAVRNDFINFFKTDKIQIACVYSNTYNRLDDDALKLLKIQKALDDNLETIKDLKGFSGAKVDFNEKEKNPIIEITFKKGSSEKSRVPEKICEFKAVILSKNE